MAKLLQNIKGDKVIWGVVIILTVFSILAVYSSTTTLAYRTRQGNTEYYLIKHLSILVFGFILMFLAHKVKYIYYARISQLAIIISVPLLLYTLLFGASINEASRWTTLPGINLMFQPSDFAKLALIMFVARMLAKRQENIKDFKSAFIPILTPVLLICGLILPANFSTAALLFVTCIVLMFIGRVNLRYIGAMIGIGGVVLALFLSFLYFSPKSSGRLGTWQNRIEHFVDGDSEENYQVEQAKIAIANGGLLGKLPGNSMQKNFLPNPFNDFIYAIIIEEYGLAGAVIVLLMYLILLYRGIRIVSKSPGNYGAFLAIGVTFSLVFQAMINMAVAVNLVPVTGQPLPLVSMGGTSIWFTSIALGIILSVSKEQESGDMPTNELQNAEA
ncbi:MAG TPA: putative peptidoglycan glycosyltransferase FtsW [Bacteroidales bacterium]|nr:putative peptidoglycan glycosyltransferase FtsW [Bacteroidales bacterium]HPT02752.1 putative peptidoglycan glycosyltransferase FtsW [Bacteroidales bacterium]